jgi:hypothetical protein
MYIVTLNHWSFFFVGKGIGFVLLLLRTTVSSPFYKTQQSNETMD